jgi:transposase-like protein
MAAGKARREYETEFKIDAAKLVENQGYAVGEAAERLGIPKANLTRWLQ